MPRRAAPAGFLSVSVGSHLNYTAPLGASNHLHFFGAPAEIRALGILAQPSSGLR